MRILVFSQYFWPESFGINALAKALQQRDVDVVVLTGQPNYPDGRIFPGYAAWRAGVEKYEGMDVLRVPVIPRGRSSSLRLIANYLSFIVSACVFAPWLMRGRSIDAVFVYAPSPLLQALPAILVAKLKRAPLTIWVQDLWPESLSATGFVKSRTVLNIVESIVRYIYRNADQVCIPSRAFREPIERLGVKPENIVYYPNACPLIPAARTTPEVAVLAAEIASGFSIVFAGNLGAAQSLETILDAAEKLLPSHPEVRFFLVGSGSLSTWLAQEVASRKLTNVRLPGRLPQDAMPDIYAAASALLVTLRDEPIFAFTIPSKVQGYLAAGKPVVAALSGEGARVVDEAGAGLSCLAEDGGALAAAIGQLFSLGADARRQMGENGKIYARKHFLLDGLADDLIGHIQQVVRRFKGTKE